MKNQKDPTIKGRKFNGNPYLKLKKVKLCPRQKIKQILRASISLQELESLRKSDAKRL